MPKDTKEVKAKNLNSKRTSSNARKSSSNKVAKKNVTKKVSNKSVKSVSSSTSKSATSKKVASSKKTSSKTTSKKSTKSISKKLNSIDTLEYYDLPYRYNQTIVKILAQTPKTLFVYWDISDIDRENYIKQYGKDFFNNTKPVLIIHNKTMNYTFEIEINDFANCWYFNINDEKCEYLVELGRRLRDFESNIQLSNNYLYITSSNEIESPNGHILFEKEQNRVFFRNVKTNIDFSKDIANLDFIKYLGKIYKLQDMYKKIYKDDEFNEGFANPSSRFS